MDVVNRSCAIRLASDRVNDARTDEIAQLESDVIVTVAENGKFGNSTVVGASSTIFAREYGMGCIDVLAKISAIGNADANIIHGSEVSVEIFQDALHRSCIDAAVGHASVQSLYIYPTEYGARVRRDQREYTTHKKASVPTLLSGFTQEIFPDFRALDFRQYTIEKLIAAIREPRKE